MTDYATFLATKERDVPRDTFAVPDPHPTLRPHQVHGVQWAAHAGRSAAWWDCGLGKTLLQIEWARHAARRSIIVAPLSVARQTVREARMIDAEVKYVRDGALAKGEGVWVTNYEMIDRFDFRSFGAAVLDESSILKNVDAKMRRRITDAMAAVPRRLACSATPAPNDIAELTNHAEFLGVASRAEMLAAYFVHDDKSWRLKGHASTAMFRWMARWAQAARSPSDLGFPDAGYQLPPLTITAELVDAYVSPGEGQLFAADLGGVGGRAKVRRQTLAARCEAAARIANRADGQVILWCGLNTEAETCADMIEGAVNVPGSWDPDRKAEAIEAFQDGAIRCLVTKPSIAGFGMNFQNCSRQVFVGLHDSYESYYQAIRRSWRFGQTSPVEVTIVVSELESAIVENVRLKEIEAGQWTDRLVKAMRGENSE